MSRETLALVMFDEVIKKRVSSLSSSLTTTSTSAVYITNGHAVESLSSATCPVIFIQFTGCNPPARSAFLLARKCN